MIDTELAQAATEREELTARIKLASAARAHAYKSYDTAADHARTAERALRAAQEESGVKAALTFKSGDLRRRRKEAEEAVHAANNAQHEAAAELEKARDSVDTRAEARIAELGQTIASLEAERTQVLTELLKETSPAGYEQYTQMGRRSTELAAAEAELTRIRSELRDLEDQVQRANTQTSTGTSYSSPGMNAGSATYGGLAGIGGATHGGLNVGGINVGGVNVGGLNVGGFNVGGLDLGGLAVGGLSISGLSISGASLGGVNLGASNEPYRSASPSPAAGSLEAPRSSASTEETARALSKLASELNHLRTAGTSYLTLSNVSSAGQQALTAIDHDLSQVRASRQAVNQARLAILEDVAAEQTKTRTVRVRSREDSPHRGHEKF